MLPTISPIGMCQIILHDYLRAHQDVYSRWLEGEFNADALINHANPVIKEAMRAFIDIRSIKGAEKDTIPAFLRKLSMLAKDLDITWCTDPIVDFHGAHEVFSNFSSWVVCLREDAPIAPDFYLYPSVEHGFVAAKCAKLEQRKEVARITYAGAVKKFGRSVELIPDWNEKRLPVMAYLLNQKFEAYNANAEFLNNTGYRVLVEGNTWNDTTWGICNKRGTNWLGLLLMAIRADQRHP